MKNREPLQRGMSESCLASLAAPSPGAGAVGRSRDWPGSEQHCGFLESFAVRSRLFNRASAICCYCLCKNNKSFQIFITISCAEEQVLCIQKWKAAPKQLPISNEAESEMRLTRQGRSKQLGARSGAAPGAAGSEAGPAGAVSAPPARPRRVVRSRVGW